MLLRLFFKDTLKLSPSSFPPHPMLRCVHKQRPSVLGPVPGPTNQGREGPQGGLIWMRCVFGPRGAVDNPVCQETTERTVRLGDL
ncbi:hypothetical protein JTE90_023157 [Oedothorax gibbosus]|uniref:Uncharacterized protein n=1 Tax=Oedothorax gibbosus TaxID=931172 RepID=A0AAV6UQ64_9ARAC|nr:hypothetical protein JTE90_023157 [Oedothorax gibbosus]